MESNFGPEIYVCPIGIVSKIWTPPASQNYLEGPGYLGIYRLEQRSVAIKQYLEIQCYH